MHFIKKMMIVFLMVLFFFCSCSTESEKHYKAAEQFRTQGRLNEAIDAYQRSIKADFNYVLAYYGLGLVYEQQGELKKAKEQYQKTLGLDKTQFDITEADVKNRILCVEGKQAFDNQNYKEVISKFQEIETGLLSSDEKSMLAKAYYEKGIYSKAVELVPGNREYRYDYARALYRKERYSLALSTFRELGNFKDSATYVEKIEKAPYNFIMGKSYDYVERYLSGPEEVDSRRTWDDNQYYYHSMKGQIEKYEGSLSILATVVTSTLDSRFFSIERDKSIRYSGTHAMSIFVGNQNEEFVLYVDFGDMKLLHRSEGDLNYQEVPASDYKILGISPTLSIPPKEIREKQIRVSGYYGGYGQLCFSNVKVGLHDKDIFDEQIKETARELTRAIKELDRLKKLKKSQSKMPKWLLGLYFVGIYYLLSLIITIPLGLIPAWIAKKKDRSFWRWWFYGSFLFLLALIHAIIIKPL